MNICPQLQIFPQKSARTQAAGNNLSSTFPSPLTNAQLRRVKKNCLKLRNKAKGYLTVPSRAHYVTGVAYLDRALDSKKLHVNQWTFVQQKCKEFLLVGGKKYSPKL